MESQFRPRLFHVILHIHQSRHRHDRPLHRCRYPRQFFKVIARHLDTDGRAGRGPHLLAFNLDFSPRNHADVIPDLRQNVPAILLPLPEFQKLDLNRSQMGPGRRTERPFPSRPHIGQVKPDVAKRRQFLLNGSQRLVRRLDIRPLGEPHGNRRPPGINIRKKFHPFAQTPE